jgi:hypothetical protein
LRHFLTFPRRINADRLAHPQRIVNPFDSNSPGNAVVRRFQGSNHIRPLDRVCRTKCE